jgi:hypothetical protein
MLFILPPRIVPLLVAAGFVLGHSFDLARGRLALSHIPVLIFNASHSLGPAVVLALASAPTPRWHDVPIYLGALAAQFTVDFLPNAI